LEGKLQIGVGDDGAPGDIDILKTNSNGLAGIVGEF
jgi:hypothetical protein